MNRFLLKLRHRSILRYSAPLVLSVLRSKMYRRMRGITQDERLHETSFLENIKQHTAVLLAKTFAGQADCPRVVVGFSGGPDSMFLLHVFQQLMLEKKCTVVAAHLDHQWREESAQEAAFCQERCLSFGIPCVMGKASQLTEKIIYNGSKEDVGRKMRRAFFNQVLQEHQAHAIALAHHMQDQQETFFLRLLRGSSLTGLCCMQEVDLPYIRPLLHLSKEQIVAYLEQKNISFMTDASNQSDAFLRNRIRKYVLPAMQQCDQRFDHNFSSTLVLLQDEERFLQELVEKTFNDVFSVVLAKNQGSLKKLRVLDVVLQRRIICYWLIKEKVVFSVSTAFFEEILRFLLQGRSTKHSVSSTVQVHKKSDAFWLEKVIEKESIVRT